MRVACQRNGVPSGHHRALTSFPFMLVSLPRFFFLTQQYVLQTFKWLQCEREKASRRPLRRQDVAQGLSLHNPVDRRMEAEREWAVLKWVSATCHRQQALGRARASQFAHSRRQPPCLATRVWQKGEAGRETSDLGYRGVLGRRKASWFYSFKKFQVVYVHLFCKSHSDFFPFMCIFV